MSIEVHTHTHTHVKNKEAHDILHTKKYVQALDKAVLAIAVLSPLSSIPQAVQVWTEKNAEGLSLITWLSWLLFTLFWLLYGLAHKEKPIIVTNLLWAVIHIAVIVGILIWG